MQSCIRHKSFLSDWFQVKQGTRHGGANSPLLYLLFIDGLNKKLEESKLGVCVYELDYCRPQHMERQQRHSPKQASTECCSCVITMLLNGDLSIIRKKCSVIVFNEAKTCQPNRIRKIGNEPIQEGTKYCHLGTIQNTYVDLNDNVHNACNRLRGTLLSIANSGLSSDSLNPLTLFKIYKSVVLQDQT